MRERRRDRLAVLERRLPHPVRSSGGATEWFYSLDGERLVHDPPIESSFLGDVLLDVATGGAGMVRRLVGRSVAGMVERRAAARLAATTETLPPLTRAAAETAETAASASRRLAYQAASRMTLDQATAFLLLPTRRALARDELFGALWNKTARPRIPTNALEARLQFGLHRRRFWNLVADTQEARHLLERAGFIVHRRGRAPVHSLTGEQLTIEHLHAPSLRAEPTMTSA